MQGEQEWWAVYDASGKPQAAYPRKRQAEVYASGFSREMTVVQLRISGPPRSVNRSEDEKPYYVARSELAHRIDLCGDRSVQDAWELYERETAALLQRWTDGARAGLEAQLDADRLEAMLQQEGGCVQVWRRTSDTSEKLCITDSREEIDAVVARWRGVTARSGQRRNDFGDSR